MFKISATLLAKRMDLNYPLTNPSIGGLIDSISQEAAFKGLGLLVQNYLDLLPTNTDSPRNKIFKIISEVQKHLSDFEQNFTDLLILYFGLMGMPIYKDSWYWTHLHSELHFLIIGVKAKEAPIKFRLFHLVTEFPSAEFVLELKKAIQECIEKISNPLDAKSLNNMINKLSLILKVVGKDDFGSEILQRLLNIWIQDKSKLDFPINFSPLIHELVKSIIHGDKDKINTILEKLRNNYGIKEFNTNDFSSGSSDASWWSNIDPNWWKEQE